MRTLIEKVTLSLLFFAGSFIFTNLASAQIESISDLKYGAHFIGFKVKLFANMENKVIISLENSNITKTIIDTIPQENIYLVIISKNSITKYEKRSNSEIVELIPDFVDSEGKKCIINQIIGKKFIYLK